MLRMVDANMGTIYRTSDSHVEDYVEENTSSRLKLSEKIVQVKIEKHSSSSILSSVGSGLDDIADTDQGTSLNPEEKRSRSFMGDYSECESFLDTILSDERPKRFKCSECPTSYAQKASLRKHRQKKHLVGDINDQSFCPARKAELFELDNNNKSSDYKGGPNTPQETCDVKTRKKVKLEKNIACGVCCKTFQNRMSLGCHQYKKHRLVLGMDQTVECEVCEGTYKNRMSLLFHQHRNHMQQLEERMNGVEGMDSLKNL